MNLLAFLEKIRTPFGSSKASTCAYRCVKSFDYPQFNNPDQKQWILTMSCSTRWRANILTGVLAIPAC